MFTSRLSVSAHVVGGVLLALLLGVADRAQAQPAEQPAESSQPPAAAPSPMAVPSPARDDTEQNLITLPTTQAMRRHGHHFRITHRFARDLGRGSLGEIASDLFGLDQGAVIGLDYRFAPFSRVQAGIYRSMLSQTIQFSGRYDAIEQGDRLPVALSLALSVEGVRNFRDDHSPAAAIVASRTWGKWLAVYASPTFVVHSVAPGAGALTGHEDHEDIDVVTTAAASEDENTAYVGLGGRVLLPKRVYVVLEVMPRLAGFAPGDPLWGVGVEKHTRGHLFQLNFSNSFGTTYGQVARGGTPGNVYLGFNIARRF
jgi:hypothetical protein